MKPAISGAIPRMLVAGADIGCVGALRFVCGTQAVLESIERGIQQTAAKSIPSKQGFRTLRGSR